VAAAVSLLTLLVAAGALGHGAWRSAAALGADGMLRVVAAAPIAAAAAVLSLLLLGRFGLSGSRTLVVGVAVALGAVAHARLPRPAPAFRLGLGRRDRLALGAAAGLGVAWTAWIVRYPGLGLDPLYYHLSEAVLWAQHGDAGAAHPVLYVFPVQAYPVNDELLVSWVLSASRWLGAASLWAPAMVGLGATAAVTGLRRAGVGLLPTALAVAAIVALPTWARMMIGPHNDLGAVAWTACAVTLAAAARARPALLVPAVLAGGLAIGTKTTPAVVLLGAAVLLVRRPFPRRGPLLAALSVAVFLGGVWFARNLFVHGSPVWPFAQLPWGDRIPALYRDVGVTFLGTLPRSLQSGRADFYFDAVAAGPLLLLGAPLAAAFVRTRRVTAAAVVTVLAALAWGVSPFTGRPLDPRIDFPFGTERYLIPAFCAGAATLALATADARGWVRRAVTALLAGCVVLSAAKALPLGFPYVPSVFTLALGAAAGWAAVRLRPRWAPLAAALLLAVVFVRVSDHFGGRHALNHDLETSGVIGYVANQPGFEAADDPIYAAPATYSALAGDRLDHDLHFLPSGVSCDRVLSLRGWLVLGTPPVPTRYNPANTAMACLDRAGIDPDYASFRYRVFDRRQTAIRSSASASPSSTTEKSSSMIAAAAGSAERRARLSRRS
jgi:hypothetical protein